MDSSIDVEKRGGRDNDTPVDMNGLVIKSGDQVDSSDLDPRLSLSSRRAADEPTSRQTEKEGNSIDDNDTVVDEPLYIEFEQGDQRNPVNFSPARKWAITWLSSFSTLLAASTAAGYSMGFESMCDELHCTHFRATIGLSTFTLGFGVVPLFTASFSEEFGRQPLYIVSAGGFFLTYILIALAPNIHAVLVGRFLQGAFGSTWATMVGGTIADIWMPQQRGLPMSIFAIAALGGTGFGPVIGGWIEMNPKLEWKWIEWVLMILCGLYILMLPVIMKETRSSILLRRIAQKMRAETGNKRYRARVEDERLSMRTMIFYRALAQSLWIGFAWGVTYALIESIPLTFEVLHGFNTGQIGTVFAAMIVGSGIGYISNTYQERLYHANIEKRGPEARLYGACFAAVLLPAGMFLYAWSSFSYVHWIVPVIGITLLIWATYIIYLAVFTYLADAYGPFASSALAGQSLCRNLAAMAFPLFTTQMFEKLGFTWAGTLFACIATLMIPIPFILFFYGPSIRAHSTFSRQVLESKPVS
ncbi:MFS polyamine transporter [Mucidula mucida]|nr:MFS polyamine transporter [Mucidula mucida]